MRTTALVVALALVVFGISSASTFGYWAAPAQSTLDRPLPESPVPSRHNA